MQELRHLDVRVPGAGVELFWVWLEHLQLTLSRLSSTKKFVVELELYVTSQTVTHHLEVMLHS